VSVSKPIGAERDVSGDRLLDYQLISTLRALDSLGAVRGIRTFLSIGLRVQ
jgi:hypothetical protein